MGKAVRRSIIMLTRPRTASSAVLASLQAAPEPRPAMLRVHELDGGAERQARIRTPRDERWAASKARKEAQARRVILDPRADRTLVVIRRDETERLISEIWYGYHKDIAAHYRQDTGDFDPAFEAFILPILRNSAGRAARRAQEVWSPLGLPDLETGPIPPLAARIGAYRVCVLRHERLAEDFAAMVGVLHEAGLIAAPVLPLLRTNTAAERDAPEVHADFVRWCSTRSFVAETVVSPSAN